MVDIETLGSAPGSVILSVGAVWFGDEGIGSEFYRTIDIFDSLLRGLTIEPETVEWWQAQGDRARAVAQDRSAMRDLGEALYDFARFIDQRAPAESYIWAKGPDFDLVLLQAAYKAAGTRIPWKYRNARDVRTLLGLAPVEVATEAGGVKHHALDDARYQAAQVIAAYQKLGLTLAPQEPQR